MYVCIGTSIDDVALKWVLSTDSRGSFCTYCRRACHRCCFKLAGCDFGARCMFCHLAAWLSARPGLLNGRGG